MLRIKSPIHTHVSRPIINTGEDFSQRILGNYELFDLSVTGEDFLHLLSRPPEIYLMEEGGGVSISGSTDIREYNTRKLEVINNFFNRILLSDNSSFTYQDRVFITDVLHKLGVTQTESFMKRVQNIRNEQYDFSRRLDAYWNHSEEMKALVEEYVSSSRSSVKEADSFYNEELNVLQQEIFQRLKTGAIYQTLSNFYQQEGGVSRITAREMLYSEQKETAEKLLLQSLINEVRGEELPLVYRHDNYYEVEAALPASDDKEARANITAAALLSVIRSIYVSRREENETYSPQWYQIAENLYRIGENTFQRITENLHRNMQLFDEGVMDLSETYLISREGDQTTEYRSNIDSRSAELSYYITEGDREERYEEALNVSNVIESETGIVNVENTTADNAEFLTEFEEDIDNSVSRNIRQELTQNIEENNREMRRTYEAHLNALTQKFEASRRRLTRSEIRRAQEEALTHPEAFIAEFREMGEQEEKRRREFDRQRQQLALTQSPDAFTLIQQYLENPEIIPPGVEITRNDIGSLIYDNRQVENSYRQTEKQTKVSEERLRRLEERGISRVDLTYLTQTEIDELERNEVDRAVIERVIEDRRRSVERREAESRLNETERVRNTAMEREIERVHLTNLRERGVVEERERVIENLSLVHKREETGIDEEVLEAIQRNRQVTRNTTEHHTTEERHETDEKVINTVVDQRLREQERRLDDLIAEGMTRQMNNLSDRVYRQIEKRLANERSRRGV